MTRADRRIQNAWAQFLLRTGKDRDRMNMIWNMAGSMVYSFAGMILAFAVIRILGGDDGGIFSFGFSTLGQQLFILAYFGVRPFHITDVGAEFDFDTYRLHRVITCLAALFLGAAFIIFMGYGEKKAAALMLLVCVKTADGFADVYESEFQRRGYLYLCGKVCAARTAICSLGLLVSMLLGAGLLFSLVIMVFLEIICIYVFCVCTEPFVPGRRRGEGGVRGLFKACGLLFPSVFLDFFIFSSARYAVDRYLGDQASGYFNILFMPTNFINLAAGFVIRPYLGKFSELFEKKDFQTFKKSIGRMRNIIICLAVLAILAAGIFGRFALGIFEKLLGSAHTGQLLSGHGVLMATVAGGGFYAVTSLYYYVLIIMRRQRDVFVIYLFGALAAAILPFAAVSHFGMAGGGLSYLFIMVMMAFLFYDFASARISKARRGRESGE